MVVCERVDRFMRQPTGPHTDSGAKQQVKSFQTQTSSQSFGLDIRISKFELQACRPILNVLCYSMEQSLDK